MVLGILSALLLEKDLQHIVGDSLECHFDFMIHKAMVSQQAIWKESHKINYAPINLAHYVLLFEPQYLATISISATICLWHTV